MIEAVPTLNAHQLRAVEYPGGPQLVLAGPGTGKTGVLVERISHLVAGQGVSPERILALTFSRRAADEMRARVTAGLPEAEKVEVRTFHSFALSIVRRHAGSLGLRSAPEFVPTNEQWALVSDILGDEDPASWGLPPGAFDRPATVREVYDLMLRAQEYLLTPRRLRDLGEPTDRPYLVRAGAVLERYGDRLKQAAKAHYEGVVQYALRLLNPGGRASKEISGLYDHVLVDEFQDTNGSQMELLRRLMPGERPNMFCVGDDAQSIYGFRGARIENVRDFEKVFPGTREIHLRTNYRSAAHIVSLAEQAIGGDESRLPSLLALCSALLEKSLQGGLITVGGLNLGRGLDPVHNAVNVAELAVEKGATALLIPISARRQLNDLSDEMATKITVLYYSDAREALIKAIGDF